MGNAPKSLVTLISASQAREGLTFIHRGESPGCRDCEYYKVCIGNLEAGRIYRITKVRDRVLRCKLHDLDMNVVEVVEAEVTAAIPSKMAVEGATIEFKTPDCGRDDCDNYNICFPVGLVAGDRCKVLRVMEVLKCPLGLSLRRASVLRRPPPSRTPR